ncbi:MAG TPA: PQQ-dependent sugar dehydrogenase [Saprospiraceae bacterium]|nr:PQQ-dependent sugar dehydrogenase [Saprospiraceae bacterium]
MKRYFLYFFFSFSWYVLPAQIRFTQVKTLSGTLTDIGHAGDGSNRVFITHKTGTITILDQAFNTLGTLLDLSGQLATDSEKGLLGLAFHPDFENNGHFFVNYNPANTNHTVIARFTASTPSANTTVSIGTLKIILTITEAANANHKGGDLAFGLDGYLYIATGDGGGGGDPQGSGQNGNILLGKILRLDIDTDQAYLVPPSNPFVSDPGIRDEIWALGLRNPWRISFDRQTQDFWIADVGQGAREEINFESGGFAGGRNYGWNCREGFLSYAGCTGNFTQPIFDYGHCNPCSNTAGTGNSITGGFVYRGTKPANTPMRGYYICGDYVSRHGWMIKYNPGSPVESKTISRLTPGGVTTFGEMENGEILAGQSNGVLGLIESTETALPFKLSRFQAHWIHPRVELRWSNHTETDLAHYTVEKSKEGLRFLSIAQVIPKKEESAPNDYIYYDEQIESGESYYRLKLTGTDQSADYSDIVRVRVPDNENSLAFYRASTREILIHPGSVSENEVLSLFAVHGNLIIEVPGGVKSIGAESLNAGVYILVVKTENGRKVQKLMVY